MNASKVVNLYRLVNYLNLKDVTKQAANKQQLDFKKKDNLLVSCFTMTVFVKFTILNYN